MGGAAAGSQAARRMRSAPCTGVRVQDNLLEAWGTRRWGVLIIARKLHGWPNAVFLKQAKLI